MYWNVTFFVRVALAGGVLWLFQEAGHAAPPVARPTSPTAAASGPTAAPSPAAAAAIKNRTESAQKVLLRTNQAIQAMKAAQVAGRTLSISGANNLGLNPNYIGTPATPLNLPDVPDGLAPNGLVPDAGINSLPPVPGQTGTKYAISSTWSGVSELSQAPASAGKTKVTVTQNAAQALLNWSSFNIGKKTILSFDQSLNGVDQKQWVAFNMVNDPTGVPSQILGSMEAPGQVYVINRNGIIFGGSSQVNTHTLVASSLAINNNLISRGLLNNPDVQFLFSELSIPAGASTPAFNPGSALTPSGVAGDVVVQKGAVLNSSSTDNVGGRIALIGSNVSNAGTISTPDGQTILAAGQQVGIAGHDSSDPSLRGLDVFVGAVNASSGTATNSGLIDAPRANVTIAGKAVDQLGVIDSTTSVSLNGRVDLNASYGSQVLSDQNATLHFYPTASGTVTTGESSVIRILPETSSQESVVGTQLALSSQVNIKGLALHLGKDSDILAPSANVSLNAGTWVNGGQGYFFLSSKGQVYLDQDASIDVGGSINISIPVSRNVISVELRGAELADSPLQREGVLRGETVQVDIRVTGTSGGQSWVGTPLADTSGYVGLIQRSVGELTTAGGSVSIQAGESVVMQPGSNIDVSGGWINYTAGTIKTTKLVSEGHVVDISAARRDQSYSALVGDLITTYSKWGVTENWGSGQGLRGTYESGYVQGANAGSISITAPAVALDGEMKGNAVSGPRQLTSPDALAVKFAGNAALPTLVSTLGTVKGGAFNLIMESRSASSAILTPYAAYSPTPPTITFTQVPALAAADSFSVDSNGNPTPLRADRKAAVELSPDLVNRKGFDNLTINNGDGNIAVPAGVNLTTAPGGSISLTGANLDVQGKIVSPSGDISLKVFEYSPYGQGLLPPNTLFTTPPTDPARGQLTLGSGAVLNVAGLIANSLVDPNVSLLINGGSVSITGHDVYLTAGSILDVSGGVAVSGTGKYSYGDGGSISILAGQDPKIESLIGGHLVMGSDLEGYSGSKGGTLTVQSPLIQVGGAAAPAGGLLLSSGFFSQGGFSQYNLIGLGATTAVVGQEIPGLWVTPGTVIEPAAQNLVAVNSSSATGISLVRLWLAEGVRTPAGISLSAPTLVERSNGNVVVRGDVVTGIDSVIRTEAAGSVSVGGGTATVLGSIMAPGGSITVSGSSNSKTLFADQLNGATALPTVNIGSQAILSAAGKTLLIPNPQGYRTGRVLDGGAIKVSGNIVAEAGALLDVSGASGVLDLAPTYTGKAAGRPIATRINSNGGSIVLKGGQELFTDATLKGAPGGLTALGGSLSISSGLYTLPGSNVFATPADVTLTVTQSSLTLPVPFYSTGQTAIGHAVSDANGAFVQGQGFFAADRFQEGKFDSLTLGGTGGAVQFSGTVTITAPRILKVGDGGFLLADASVNLAAPYVSIGTSFLGPQTLAQQALSTFLVEASGLPFYAAPTFGPGNLTVSAGLIDIGNLSLQNIGSAQFIATNGDIRGDGTLNAAGDITLRAGQVYPATDVTFNIEAYNHGATPGSVNFVAAGNRALPLSAGGKLNVYGSVIQQAGNLQAPIGTINLGWDGTGNAPIGEITNTAVPVTQQLTLAAGSTTSVSAVDPVTGKGILIPYGTNLNGVSWIDPAGIEITSTGLPSKQVNISAVNVADQAGSTIDIRGGGDLYAYRWVKGLGGTKDILASTSSFAVIPNYKADYAPSDPGYANSTLGVGDKIYLSGGGGLPAGYYTLLPARYALLPGAFLVTPKSGIPVKGTQSDGSVLASGYRYSGLGTAPKGQQVLSSFEVASASVVKSRAEYDGYLANTFLKESALARNVTVPRLPTDSGRLLLAATQTMTLDGRVVSRSVSGGRGSLVDISSPSDILIASSGATAAPGVLVLDSSSLSSFGADSLLIGGVRQVTAAGTSVTVTTNKLTVDNAGATLKGPDIVLAANQSLVIAANARIEQDSSSTGTADTIHVGTSDVAGSGDGVIVRVGSDPNATVARAGVDASTVPSLTVGAGARIAGNSVTLDSTSATSMDSAAVLEAQTISLGSGRISMQLTNPGSLEANPGLVLSSAALQNLQASTKALGLLSYSSIDIYGSGEIGGLGTSGQFLVSDLALHTAEIRGFNAGGGTVTVNAQNVVLDNSPGRAGPGAVSSALPGTLVFNAGTVQLGSNQLNIDQYENVRINASGGILTTGKGGLGTAGSLTLTIPLLTGSASSQQTVKAGGILTITAPASGVATVKGGLGASLKLEGTSIVAASKILLPSGTLSLRATNGVLQVDGRLDVSGTAQRFYDLVKYTNGGNINLTSDTDSVTVGTGAVISVAAASAGGNAGTLTVGAKNKTFTSDGVISGQAGVGGKGGSLSLDVATLDVSSSLHGSDLAILAQILTSGGFSESQTIRVRGDGVDNDVYAAAGTTVLSRIFNLSADQGSITVGGIIDARGTTGGMINLRANGSVTLESGSVLTVAATDFDAAGKGGAVSLEAGSQTNGTSTSGALGTGPQVEIQTGSTINLSVAANATPADVAANAALGKFSGSLHMRAPQTTGGTDVQIKAVDGAIVGASRIIVEGYKVYTPAGGAIDTVKSAILSDGGVFAGTANAADISDRLFAANPVTPNPLNPLQSVAVIAPGAEIINTAGDLTLTSDWDLSTFRFGSKGAAGVLTMRASGNLVFNGALSDGFSGGASLWQATLMAPKGQLPVNAQSWSYRLTAGADLSAADFRFVRPLDSLGAASGSLLLGRNGTRNISNPTGANAVTSTAVAGHFQVIRTGSGDIEIATGRDVQLLNQFATIYTAGTQVTSPTVLSTGSFDVPVPFLSGAQGALGAVQQTTAYPAQYSMAGGNVTIDAQGDIIHLTRDLNGNIIADSSKELPNNWLYRRGYVNPLTGQFGASRYLETASTSWWVDFSNFFEGVGALGGGNVTMTAGNDITNVDAVVPTNARMPKGTPDASKMIELGGGDLVVRAGHNIDGGVYYVERGKGTLTAGNEIKTNATRSPSLAAIFPAQLYPESSWLPTTLFVGKGSFEVTAQNDVLLGPVANPFILPQGFSNTYWYKTYFSTYGPSSAVSVSSLTGDVTLREVTVLPGEGIGGTTPLLQVWLQNMHLLTTNPASLSFYQPWLRLDETRVDPFSTLVGLMPPTLKATAFSGDINLVGNLTLSPSSQGTVDLAAAGSLNGLQPGGVTTIATVSTRNWVASRINLSDADPNAIPGITSPFAYQVLVGTNVASARTTSGTFLLFLNALFNESGSITGAQSVLQTQQALHAGKLHEDDLDPVHLYSQEGDISGLTLFSGKAARIVAGQDISDIGLYIQNLRDSDISIVSSGRDIIAYNPNSPLLTAASQAGGNTLAFGSSVQSGDIQISGPGALEVLAGRNLDLGIGPVKADGTGLGLVSIGKARNPALPFEGADIIAGAGMASSYGTDRSRLNVTDFISKYVDSPLGEGYLKQLGTSRAAFNLLPEDQQVIVAMDVFYAVLREAGRNHGDPSSAGFGNYNSANEAIATLFPGEGAGDISLTSREIKTRNGGNISLLAPHGSLNVGFDVAGTQPLDQGILTESGGDISIFTDGSVIVGTSRIFTLRGGNEIIWSSHGDIAAGASSKTVQSAPPTRVIIDSQSADVATDLAGLATGGGIGVLDTVAGVAPGNIDLIAPTGTVDAGDAGIRVSGNLNISAARVANASNIQVGGANVGGNVAAPAAPNIGGLTAASTTSGATANSAGEMAKRAQNQTKQQEELPSIITVEVLGYGGGDGTETKAEDSEDKKKEKGTTL